MSSPVRELATDTQAEIIKQHTLPVMLAKIEFPTATVYLSEARAVVWEGNTYLEGAMRMGLSTWTSDGEQSSSIALMNDNSSATSIALNSTFQGAVVTVWQTYIVSEALISDPDYVRVTSAEDTRVVADGDTRVVPGTSGVLLEQTFTTPELLLKGVLEGAEEIGPEETVMAITSSNSSTEFVPNKFYGIETGFNYLPRPGTVIEWSGERFVLEAESG